MNPANLDQLIGSLLVAMGVGWLAAVLIAAGLYAVASVWESRR